jgi:hypothetical protein
MNLTTDPETHHILTIVALYSHFWVMLLLVTFPDLTTPRPLSLVQYLYFITSNNYSPIHTHEYEKCAVQEVKVCLNPATWIN